MESSLLLSAVLGRVPALILAACAVSLGAALTAQYGFGLDPCILCLYQRIPFAAAAVLALIALVPAAAPARAALTGLCAVTFAAGAGLAVYHVGVEQHWWVSSCAGALPDEMSLQDLRALASKPQRHPCDQPNWTVLGLSMASWNVAWSGGLALGSAVAAVRLRRKTDRRG